MRSPPPGNSGPNGVTFNPLTGAPTTVSNNFAGLHPGLFRTTTASIAATVVHPRDIYNLSFAHSNSQQLENGIAGSSIDNSNTSSSMTGSWGHDLSPDMHSSILAQYGINSGAGFTNEGFSNNQGSYLLSASINYSVSDTLNVSASFTQTNGPTGFTSKTGSHEIAIVTVHKTIY